MEDIYMVIVGTVIGTIAMSLVAIAAIKFDKWNMERKKRRIWRGKYK